MNEQIKFKIDKFFDDFEYKNDKKYLDYIINSCEYLLQDIEMNKEKKKFQDYLIGIFNNDDDSNDFQFYVLSSEIENHINNITFKYEILDDDNNNYLNASIILNNIKIIVYIDYRVNGNKTGGNMKFTFTDNCDFNITFNNDYDFIEKNTSYEDIELLFEKFKNTPFYKTKNNEISRLSLFIPKYFYEQIY